MPSVKNVPLLLHGEVAKRMLALEAFQAALDAVDPTALIDKNVRYADGTLYVKRKAFPAQRIFVIGFGKASRALAEAFQRKVPIEAGIVAVPEGTAQNHPQSKIKYIEGTHPLPSNKSEEAALELLKLAPRVKPGDLVVCLISGGGSALVELPQGTLTISDIRSITDQLMKAGADIVELNEVRKCLSRTKGGQIGAQFAKAKIVNLILSDVIGSPVREIASGPTVSNVLDYPKALSILKDRLTLAAQDPALVHVASIKTAIPISVPAETFVLADNNTALDAAAKFLKSKGLAPKIVRNIRGEAWEQGAEFAARLNKGHCLVAGGETTVTVRGRGVGGRNQELALGACLHLKKGVLLAAGTDGRDGSSDHAGAIVDGETLKQAQEQRLDLGAYLNENDSSSFFAKTKDAIRTGLTGTNVCDLVIAIP